MGSETGAKWFIVIIIYFVVMTFIISLISSVSDTTIQTNTDTVTGYYCDTPRVSYIAYEPTLFVDMESTFAPLWRNYFGANVDCDRSLGVRSETDCDGLEGCSWEERLEDWWNPFSGAETCTGELNYTFITTTGTHYVFPAGKVIDDFQNQYNISTNEICTHPDILNNETLCELLSCDYRNHESSVNIDVNDASLSTLGKVWETAKEIITLRFDFETGSDLADGFLYFLIFVLPLIAFVISGYVMVRS